MLKRVDQRWSDIYIVFTKILCGHNFCVYEVTKLKFTGPLQMASLSLYPQLETNLMSNRKVNKLLLQLKSPNSHGKNYLKVKPHWSAIFIVIVYKQKEGVWYDVKAFWQNDLYAEQKPKFKI